MAMTKVQKCHLATCLVSLWRTRAKYCELHPDTERRRVRRGRTVWSYMLITDTFTPTPRKMRSRSFLNLTILTPFLTGCHFATVLLSLPTSEERMPDVTLLRGSFHYCKGGLLELDPLGWTLLQYRLRPGMDCVYGQFWPCALQLEPQEFRIWTHSFHHCCIFSSTARLVLGHKAFLSSLGPFTAFLFPVEDTVACPLLLQWITETATQGNHDPYCSKVYLPAGCSPLFHTWVR